MPRSGSAGSPWPSTSTSHPPEGGGGLELDVLLAARHRLDPGEVVTLLVPVSRALGALHAQRVALDGVRASDVRIDASGRPVLQRRAALAGADVPDEALAQDVRSLAVLAWLLLTGTPRQSGSLLDARPDVPLPLAALVGSVLGARSPELPTALQYADALFASCPALPVGFPPGLRPEAPGHGADPLVPDQLVPDPLVQDPLVPDPLVPDPLVQDRPVAVPGHPGPAAGVPGAAAARGPAPRPRGGGTGRAPGRRRAPAPRRPALLGALVLGALLALGALALQVGGGSATAAVTPGRGHAPAPGSPAPGSPAPGSPANGSPAPGSPVPGSPAGSGGTASAQPWSQVVQALDSARAVAWGSADATALAATYVPGSPALQRDAALLRDYRTHGVAVEGLRSEVLQVSEERRARGEVHLRVRDRMSAYVLRLPDGTRVERPARPAREWLVELRLTAAGWRTWDVAGPSQG